MSVSEKIRGIYSITKQLEEMYPGRHFTPDGHLVGSLGEVLVAADYGLALLPASHETHDALSVDGRLVQIKATQVKKIAISSKPDYLIVIQIKSDGTYEEIYNGKGASVWDGSGVMQKNGQRSITLHKLRKLHSLEADADRIPRTP
ncbi:DUF6998 domain-containing protein [Dysosmobacter sp.]